MSIPSDRVPPPTSAELAVALTPWVQSVLRARWPILSFFFRVLPFVTTVIEITLKVLPLFFAAATRPVLPGDPVGAGPAAAPEEPPGLFHYPWHDEESDIPDDIRDAAIIK